jgi:biotin carboxyl carrier protein
LSGPDSNFVVEAVRKDDVFQVTVGKKKLRLKLGRTGDPDVFVAQFEDKPLNVVLEAASGQGVTITIGGERMSFRKLHAREEPETAQARPITAPGDTLPAPMPGRVVGIMTKTGERIRKGDPLIIIESMKMETVIRSDRDAKVEKLLVDEGSSVKRGQALVRFTG